MKNILSFFLLLSIMKGVFGETDLVSVMEGDSVTLHTGLTEIQNIKVIDWRSGDIRIAQINRPASMIETKDNELGGKFKGRLKLDDQTGYLTISNTSTTDTGSYKVTITSDTKTSITFSLTVKPADAVGSISVMVGDSVTLHPDVTEIQRYDVIHWRFQNSPVAEFNRKEGIFNTYDDADGRFRDRLQLECLSRSLTVNNIGTKHSGLYEVDISSSKHTIHKTFSVTFSGELTSVSVMDSVTLTTHTELRRDDFMLWMVGDTVLAEINQTAQQFPTSEGTERFRDRLKLDNQTGSLIITNTKTTDSGLYELKIHSSRRTILRRIIVTVPDSVSTFCYSGTPCTTIHWILFAIGFLVVLVLAVLVKRYHNKISELERRLEKNGQNHKKQNKDDHVNEETELNNP